MTNRTSKGYSPITTRVGHVQNNRNEQITVSVVDDPRCNPQKKIDIRIYINGEEKDVPTKKGIRMSQDTFIRMMSILRELEFRITNGQL